MADEVASGHVDQGLLVCGSGTGMAIAANKVPGVRAAVAWNEDIARLAREHNKCECALVGGALPPLDELKKIVRAWFAASFDGDRHARRVDKIREIEQEKLTHSHN